MSNPSEDRLTSSAPDTAEHTLIEALKRGNLGAFDQLVLAHQQQVFAVALRMLGNYDEAQEVAQEAFVRAYRSLHTFRHEAKLSTWLVAITMNLCRNQRRWWARRRRVIVASLDDPPINAEEGSREREVVDPSPNPAMAVEYREQHQHVMAAIQMLSETERSVVVLRDIQGYSYEEVAKILHTRVGTVKSRLNRARLHLRALMDGTLT